MLRYVYWDDARVADFVSRRTNSNSRRFRRCPAIGVEDATGELIGGVVYSNFDRELGIIEMTMAGSSPRWFTRDGINDHFYAYPFRQLECQMTMSFTPADNERALGIVAAIGYQLIRVPRLFGRNCDGVIGVLTIEAWLASKLCRWNKDQQRKAA